MQEAGQMGHTHSEALIDYYPDIPEHLRHPLLKMTRANMHNAWRKDNQLVAKFFPIEPKFAPAFLKAQKERYNKRIGRKRWTRIPAAPKSVNELFTPLTELFNRILFLCQISRLRRLFINTHLRKRKVYEMVPGIVLSGIGQEFATSSAAVPRAFFSSYISAFEIALESDNLIQARDRLAVHMHRIFQDQGNRRFAFGGVITQNTFTVYMFDHAGAVSSEPFNYHENPEQLLAIISGLAGDGPLIGFDTTMGRMPGHTAFRTLETRNGRPLTATYYKVESCLFRFAALVGRGTMCWLVTSFEDPPERFVIKDAWILEDELEGKEPEGALLRHAQSMGVILGLAQIRHAEDVQLGIGPFCLDTIGRNSGGLTEPQIDRVHRRIVMKAFGKTLDKFNTRQELILAFHDAVLAHRNLHQIAGILHRDISPNNILININGVEGDRGILIDLDHAIRVDDTSPYSARRKIGTWRYMSRNVLGEDEPHTYLDDLESFFYILYWIVSAYELPRVVIPNLPFTVSLWDDPGAAMAKHGLFSPTTETFFQPWFGRCIHDLLLRLLKFVKSRRPLYGLQPPTPNPEKDYEEFLSHVRQCMVELEAEDHPKHQSTQDVSINNGHADAITPQKPPSAPRKRRRARVLLPEPKAYPKRSTANYGTV